jgi:hypothetical protein
MWRRKSREDRRKEKFLREVGPLLEEGRQLQAATFLRFTQGEIDSGQIRSDEEWGAQWAESSNDDLHSVLRSYTEGLESLLSPAQFAEVTGAIRSEDPFPGGLATEPLAELMARRTRYLVRELRARGDLSGP